MSPFLLLLYVHLFSPTFVFISSMPNFSLHFYVYLFSPPFLSLSMSSFPSLWQQFVPQTHLDFLIKRKTSRYVFHLAVVPVIYFPLYLSLFCIFKVFFWFSFLCDYFSSMFSLLCIFFELFSCCCFLHWIHFLFYLPHCVSFFRFFIFIFVSVYFYLGVFPFSLRSSFSPVSYVASVSSCIIF